MQMGSGPRCIRSANAGELCGMPMSRLTGGDPGSQFLWRGICDASHPPPNALINWTLATICCIRKFTAACWSLSKAVWAVITFRYGSRPALYRTSAS